jgi:hypothetical protein
MKISKSIKLHALSAAILLSGLAIGVYAQKGTERNNPRCTATASNVYFVDSGSSVTVLHPGSNGGNGYQLNIMGTNVDKFEVEKMPFMTSLNIIPNYTNASSAKWGLEFAAHNGQYIRAIRMKNKCTGETTAYKLDATVQLLDQ